MLFCIYALVAVPIITSFALSTVSQILGTMSEKHFIARKKGEDDPDDSIVEAVLSHHDLVIKHSSPKQSMERSQNEEIDRLILAALQLETCSRNLLLTLLDDDLRILMHADLRVQLRDDAIKNLLFSTLSQPTDQQALMKEIVDISDLTKVVDPEKSVHEFRSCVARLLVSLSRLQQLQGEEARIFERRKAVPV